MSSFSKNGDVINYEILSGVLEQFGAEITSNLQKDLDWASPSAHSSPTSNSPSTQQRQLPLILRNLTGVSIIIEYFILSGCQSFDGEPVAPTERISTRSTRSESDFVVIDKESQNKEEIPSSDTRLYEDNTFLKTEKNALVNKLLSVYDSILYASGENSNTILWQRCNYHKNESHPCNSRGPLIFVLLRLSVYVLRQCSPCSEHARINSKRIKMLVSSLMWGINRSKVRSPSASIDVFDGGLGIGGREATKSLSDVSSVADLLEALGTGRSSRNENTRERQRRKHSSSFESNAGMGMYMLEEEEQWATVLIREIKIALIKTRSTIFDRKENSSQTNPSSSKDHVDNKEFSTSLSIADKVSALSFGTESNAGKRIDSGQRNRCEKRKGRPEACAGHFTPSRVGDNIL